MTIKESNKQKAQANLDQKSISASHYNWNSDLKLYLLLILFVLANYLAFIFYKRLTPIDTTLFIEISKMRMPFFDILFIFLTNGGGVIFILSIILILWVKGERRPAIYLAAGLIIDTILVYALKTSIHRPRPYEILSIPVLELGDSFGSLPSGHTSRAFLCATILSNFYHKYLIIFFLMAILVGFSRIYLGSHYPLDVLIGSINGILLGMIVVSLLDRLR